MTMAVVSGDAVTSSRDRGHTIDKCAATHIKASTYSDRVVLDAISQQWATAPPILRVLSQFFFQPLYLYSKIISTPPGIIFLCYHSVVVDARFRQKTSDVNDAELLYLEGLSRLSVTNVTNVTNNSHG